MKLLLKVIAILAAVGVGFFVLTFTVYFYNLDMKLMAAIDPYLRKIYDRRKRERQI